MKANGFERDIRRILAPNPYRHPVEFLEHFLTRIPYSARGNGGGFSISSAPWLREPLEAIFDPEVQAIGVQAAVQLGKSLLIEGASCIIPVNDPGPTLILTDIDRNAKDYLESRLTRVWNVCEPTRAQLPAQVPKEGVINFLSNPCWVLGAKNDSNLHGRSIRYLFGDEVWRWDAGALARAERRVSANKARSKTVFVSQAGLDGGEWAFWYAGTDQRVWTWVCPSCGTAQGYEWDQVIFPKEAKKSTGWDLNAVKKGTTYQCKGCKVHFPDRVSVRTDLNLSGHYVAQNPDASRRGYHWNALCAQELGLSWGELAVECIEAKMHYSENGDNSKRRDFLMQRMAQTYKEEADEIQIGAASGKYKLGDAWDDEGGFVMGKPRAGKDLTGDMRAGPDFVRMRFMGVDFQQSGFYWVVRSFSGDGRSRLVGCGFCLTLGEIADLAKKNEVHAANVFLDSGYKPDDALMACAAHGWTATRGDQRNEFPWKIRTPMGNKVEMRAYSTPVVESVGQKRCKRFYFSNLRTKDTLSMLIRKGLNTYAEDVPEEYLKQMQSERREIRTGGRPVWEQIDRRPNHFWDCEVIITLPAMAWRLIGKAAQLAEEPQPDAEEAQEG
jgi:hypothetical protein